MINRSSSCCGTVSAPSTVVSCRDIALATEPRLWRDRTTAESCRCCQGVPVGACTLSLVSPPGTFCLAPWTVGDGEEMPLGCWLGCERGSWGHLPRLAASLSWGTPIIPWSCPTPLLGGPQSPPLLSDFSCAGLVGAILTHRGGAFTVGGQTSSVWLIGKSLVHGCDSGCRFTWVL